MSESLLERTKRISDMMCTAHAVLRDRYKRRALLLDLTIIALTTWITATVFVDPRIGGMLTPAGVDREIWIGCLSVFAAFLSFAQMCLDWKGLAEAHGRASVTFGNVKSHCVELLNAEVSLPSTQEIDRVLQKYAFACESNIPISEEDFLVLKRRHKIKVEISKLLDQKPGSSVLLTALKIWWRDNIHARSNGNSEKG